MPFLFVYGTLKRGYGNNHLIAHQALLGAAVSMGRYRMWNVGFPLLSSDSYGSPAKGELYAVSTKALHRCDQLEGHPNWYCRVRRHFKCDDQVYRAWVYLVPLTFPPTRSAQPVLPQNGILEWERVPYQQEQQYAPRRT